MSSITTSGKNVSASVDIAEDIEVGKGDGGDDKTIKRLSSKKSSGPMGYLTSIRSKKVSKKQNKAVVGPIYNS